LFIANYLIKVHLDGGPFFLVGKADTMGRGRCTFKQQDLTRALKAAAAAGTPLESVVIDKEGKIILVARREGLRVDEEQNEWDEPNDKD
jgi:hypothetical protein